MGAESEPLGRIEAERSAQDGLPVSLADLCARLGPEDRALLEEAMRLTSADEPAAVLRVALQELVERQRFLNWVAQHERAEQGGNA